MSAVNSKVGMCNLALGLLKVDAIVSIDAPTIAIEEVCAKWYDTARRTALKQHTWNFALKRSVWTPDTTAPAFGYTYAYNLPNDFIRLVTINDEDYPDDKYEIEGTQLLIDEGTSLNVRYIRDEDVVSKFDPAFVNYFALYLASVLAYEVTGNEGAVARIEAKMDKAKPEAFALDGQDRPPEIVEVSNWKTKRQMYRSTSASPYVVFR